ncbi:hypothetical protein WKW50_16250 [Ochrobactrum sp. GPK 3]
MKSGDKVRYTQAYLNEPWAKARDGIYEVIVVQSNGLVLIQKPELVGLVSSRQAYPEWLELVESGSC